MPRNLKDSVNAYICFPKNNCQEAKTHFIAQYFLFAPFLRRTHLIPQPSPTEEIKQNFDYPISSYRTQTKY